MQNIKILWVDDEIHLLKPHLIFLKNKGYEVDSANNGNDALDLFENQSYDMVFLDENMPGISGLETLTIIKEKRPNLPVVMITKNEEEQLMEEAIGSKITDYLIKPVNPNQILLCLKKNLDHARLVSEKTIVNYQQEFRKISEDLSIVNDVKGWVALYKKILHWELELEQTDNADMLEILKGQQLEANGLFFKFIQKNYKSWIQNSSEAPLLSHDLMKKLVFPEVSKKQKTLLVVIDNLRYDQYKVIEKTILTLYKKEKEHAYFSILPTATQYARNALFSGLLPNEMSKLHPDLWKNDEDEGGMNLYESEFLEAQIKRLRLNIDHQYFKVNSLKASKTIQQQLKTANNKDLTVLVYNFVDMLSHAKTEVEVIKELARNDQAFRATTKSWFANSPLFEMIKQTSTMGMKLVLTTDHGTINVHQPSKVIGDRKISSNLRYKTGKSLTFESKEVYHEKKPNDIGLPPLHMSSSYIFAKENYFFAYPNNFNHFVNYYRNTYQHGGISMEEVIIPFAIFEPK